MDYFLRVRSSGRGRESKREDSIRERIPSQKTQSFKEKKKGLSWLQRKFMGHTSQDFSSSDIEKATAVAAAAYAINSLEDSDITGWKLGREDSRTPLTKIKSQKDGTTIAQEVGRQSKRFTDESEGLGKGKSPSMKRTPSLAERFAESPAYNEPKPDQSAYELPRQPTMKAENAMAKQPTRKSESPLPPLPRQPRTKPEYKVPKSDQAATERQIPSSDTIGQTPTRPRTDKTESDSWKEEELARVRERYKKLNEKILEWESKKKEKARRKLRNKEGELERRKAKALQHFNDLMEKIDNVAKGARAHANQRQLEEEIKVKQKAVKIGESGKVPTNSCFFC